jgi:hypothetical protein
MRVVALSTLCVFLAAAGLGCVNIGGGTWSAPQSLTLKLDPASLHSLDVRTGNGAIEFSGGGGGEAEAVVIATKRGMGHDAEAAEAALRDIQVFVKADGHGGQSIGWRWATEPKPADWQAEVAFKIKAPPRLSLILETHNGTIDVNGVTGEVRAITHNGAISTNSRGEGLDALTYNGEIHATYDGPRISLVTHNGTIHADLEHCASLAGRIESHNGAIIVTIGSKTSADWDCHTANGQVHFDPPADNATTADRHFKGRTAAGGTPVVLSSHNGEVHVRAGRQ